MEGDRLGGLPKSGRHSSGGQGVVYDIGLADYIRRNGIDKQALLDGFAIQKEPEKTRKEAVQLRWGYRRRADLTNEELADIVDMYRHGAKIKHIAGKFNIRSETVNKILDSADVARRRKPTRRVDKKAAIDMLLAGASAAKVAEVLECAEHTILEYRRELKDTGRL